MRTLLLGINSKYIHTALGMHSIYCFCKQQGFDVSLCEETVQTPILAVLAEVSSYEPEIVGIDVHIWNKDYVFSLVSLIRKVLPTTKIVLGGPEVSFTVVDSFAECSAADYIVQGEGEAAFANLLAQLERGNAITPKNVAWRDSDGTIYNSGEPAVIEDLSVLPFPYENIDQLVECHKIVYYECTRGCPFNCSYCLSGISHDVRRKPLKTVLTELDRFIVTKVPLVKFVDRTYNLDESYFVPIMEHLAQAETNAVFHFEIKADLLSKKVLAFLETVPKGRFQFEIGVQTTNTNTLAAIGRRDNWQALASNVKEILSFGNIHVHLDLIAGLPFEDLASYKRSFNDVYGLRPQMLQLGFLKILKGSLLCRQSKEQGIVYMDTPPYEVLQTNYIPYREMRFLKIFEDVFDHTYNTGKFEHTLSYLLANAYDGDAFALFKALTDWWEQKGLYPAAHSVRNMAFLLKEFCEDVTPALTEEMEEVLRFDIFLAQPNWRPEIFTWHDDELKLATLEFWRRNEVVKKYLPDYDFSTWRKIRKCFPIEKFLWHPQKGKGEGYVILADYTEDETRYIEIEGMDFYDN